MTAMLACAALCASVVFGIAWLLLLGDNPITCFLLGFVAGTQVRREREFRLRDQKRKIEMDARKMDAIADMKVAMAEERVAKKREERIELDRWKSETTFERHITPVSILHVNHADVVGAVSGRCKILLGVFDN